MLEALCNYATWKDLELKQKQCIHSSYVSLLLSVCLGSMFDFTVVNIVYKHFNSTSVSRCLDHSAGLLWAVF